MRIRLTVALLAVVGIMASPAVAAARVPASKLLRVQPGSPLAMVSSNSAVPLGFSISAGQAIRVAESSPTLQALHRRVHPLEVFPYVWRTTHPYWYVELLHRDRIVADATVSPSGKLTGVWTGQQALAPYTHGNTPPIVDSPLVVVPFSLLFLLAFFDPRRLRSLRHLDALAVLAFLVSYELFAHGDLMPAVWLVYPPLLYLLARLGRIGFSARITSRARLAPLLSLRTLAIGVPLLLGARIALSLLGHQEIDVGYQSVIGASRILHHLPIYWNDPNHGDTYGPVTYLTYVPFDLIFPWAGSLGKVYAADAAAIFFDLATVGGLVLLGRRLRSGAAGIRLGLILAWAWAACPFTVIGLIEHTNDALISLLSVLVLLTLTSATVSGALLGLAAAAKFSPAGLLPLIAAGRQRGKKGALICVISFTAVLALAIFAWLPPRGLAYFWQRTIGFQMTRPDVFSPWALHPGLHPIQVALEVGAVALAGVVAFLPRRRGLVEVCALAGAVTLAIQLPATHWFYYYILWFLPFALVAMLVPKTPTTNVPAADAPEDPVVQLENRRLEPIGELVGV
jgi:hypothetical protein